LQTRADVPLNPGLLLLEIFVPIVIFIIGLMTILLCCHLCRRRSRQIHRRTTKSREKYRQKIMAANLRLARNLTAVAAGPVLTKPTNEKERLDV